MQGICEDSEGGEGMSYYIHTVPGRLRIKTPSIKGDPVKARELEGIAGRIPGVCSATANPITGSVVVTYDEGGVSSGRIIEIFNRKGHFDSSKAVPSARHVEDGLSRTGKFLGKALLGIIADRVLEGTPLSLLAAIL